MQTARRLYLYLLSGTSLGVLVAGVSMLVAVLLDRLGFGAMAGPLFGDDQAVRQQLTLAAALTTVSLPVWLIHWFAAERGVRPTRPSAATERNSVTRGLYFALAMGALLFAAATATGNVLSTAVLALAGADAGFRNPAADLALLLTAGGAWAYHVVIRGRDWAAGPMVGAAAFLPRTYLYVATFVGLLVFLFGVNGHIELIGRLLLDEPPAFVGDGPGPWWASPLATAMSQLIVGGSIWLGHAWYAGRLLKDAGWRGANERPARLRLTFFVAVIAASAIAVAFFLAEGAHQALAAALGVSEGSGSGQIAGLVILPLLSAVPFAIAWSLHQRRLRAEAMTFDSTERVATADRLASHTGALVGLAFAAVGIAWVLRLAIEVALAGDRVLGDSDVWLRELAQFVPVAAVGCAVWLWSWMQVGSRYAGNPVDEAASTTRRAALLTVLALSLLAAIGSTGLILYRLFGSIFGVQASGNVVLELSSPTGVLIVAGLAAIYHGLALRRDQAIRTTIATATSPTAPSAPLTAVSLRLLGPRDGDTDAALVALRERLPVGYSLEIVAPSG